MRTVDYLTIAGLIIGPLAAVLITIYFEGRRRGRAAREQTLRALLQGRETADDANFNLSIKTIPIDYRGYPAVIATWESYFENLSRKTSENDEAAILASRRDKSNALIIEMLVTLGYKRVDAARIARAEYISKGMVDNRTLQFKVMNGIVEMAEAVKRIEEKLNAP